MKVYLVGGAVRDQLLQYPIVERDWVVVGATPEYMISQGYRQVGRDFPVFIHPKTHEEYALARTERKSGQGYYGFECDYDVHVSLEEDLRRRDLTINAIAVDDAGQFIDPYHGIADIQAKILRHVSDSFVEDPVRVLRIARFAARYHHLGFKVAEETRRLMVDMVSRGELAHLVPERVWQEMVASLAEKNPEIFISTLRDCGALQVILPEIDSLFGIPASPKYHPEIDTGIHTLKVLQAITRLTPAPMLRFAALVHDVGKAATPMHLWPRHPDHESQGLPIIETLANRLRIPNEWRKCALMACQDHLNIHRIEELSADSILRILERNQVFRCLETFIQLLTVCRADALRQDYPQAQKWLDMIAKISAITAKEIVNAGFTGVAIKHELEARRRALLLEILGDSQL